MSEHAERLRDLLRQVRDDPYANIPLWLHQQIVDELAEAVASENLDGPGA